MEAMVIGGHWYFGLRLLGLHCMFMHGKIMYFNIDKDSKYINWVLRI